MIIKTPRKERRKKRHARVRVKISGTKDVPRLSFYRSNKHFYAQLVDDRESRTLVFSSTVQPSLKKEIKSTWSKEAAKKIGESIAKIALGKGIKKVLFDRGGNKYHGNVVAFAEGARSSGLEF